MRKTFQVIHCEPSTVKFAYQLFPHVIELADTYGIPLNIQMHPNWMKFAYENAGTKPLFEEISQAMTTGHIIGIHHHGLTHPTNWDGYTNVPYDEIPEEKQGKYIGNMEKFEEIIAEFELRIGLASDPLNMGSMTDEATDFISRYMFSTNGIKPFDGLSKPKLLTFNNFKTIQVGHAFLSNEIKMDIAATLFLSEREGIFGAIFHLENYAASPKLFEQWFKFIVKNGEVVDIYEACN